MNIVQPLVVVIPSLLTHIWIFVVRCYAEHHNAPVVMVFEDLLELFDRCYRDDFVGFEGFWRLFRVVTVSFCQGESICYCFKMHFVNLRRMQRRWYVFRMIRSRPVEDPLALLTQGFLPGYIIKWVDMRRSEK
ncbi:hypothetical protein BGZ57DRAFT_906655 [Hyaloscypha finlandica]|nr:hypothetical protein BGZ57DRAFT_906655 [Hyaloscypha finlandica]